MTKKLKKLSELTQAKLDYYLEGGMIERSIILSILGKHRDAAPILAVPFFDRAIAEIEKRGVDE